VTKGKTPTAAEQRKPKSTGEIREGSGKKEKKEWNPARLLRKGLSNRGGSGNWPWKLEVVAVAEGKTPTAATAGIKNLFLKVVTR
jgi:hypothetical protein